MTAAGARVWLDNVDGDLLRSRLTVVPANFYTAPPHATHCDVDSCGGLFLCWGCDRFVGWCLGAADDKPNHCDECWAAEDRKKKGKRTT